MFDSALSVYFSLTIDSTDLGMFISCEGLAAERLVPDLSQRLGKRAT